MRPGRMDSYVDEFMANGGSFITLAKGNRSKVGVLLLGSLGILRFFCQDLRASAVGMVVHGL